MDKLTLKPILEAMIFVSEEPLAESSILTVLANDGVDKDLLRECIVEIEKEWNENPDRGISLQNVAGGYQFRTKESHAEWIKRLNIPKPMRLSAPALETLAIVAYRQPIVRSEIERIRGVDSGAVLKTLLDRRLLRIVGRQDEPGQPLLYGTTKDFLETFNLKALGELPTLKDIEELMRERRTATDQRPLEEEVEEPTEVIDEGVDKEPTEAIPRNMPIGGEEKGEEKDEEALASLEQNLKDLRRLERNIFPRPVNTGADANAPGDENDAAEISAIPEEGGAASSGGTPRAEGAETDADPEDAPPADDRPLH